MNDYIQIAKTSMSIAQSIHIWYSAN